MLALSTLPKGILLFTTLSLTLTACQQREEPANTLEDPGGDVVVSPGLSDAAPERTEPEPQPPVPESAPPEPTPLNLDIPEDLLEEQARTGFPQTSDSRLPDLFAKKKRAGTSLSGELLFDENEDIDVDTISGAKITISIPTGNKE